MPVAKTCRTLSLFSVRVPDHLLSLRYAAFLKRHVMSGRLLVLLLVVSWLSLTLDGLAVGCDARVVFVFLQSRRSGGGGARTSYTAEGEGEGVAFEDAPHGPAAVVQSPREVRTGGAATAFFVPLQRRYRLGVPKQADGGRQRRC